MYDIQVETIQNVAVVYLSGRFHAMAVRQIEPQIMGLIQEGNKIIIHMGGVEFLSSLALWMLLSAQRQMKDRNGKLVIVAITAPVAEILSLVGFTSVIQTFPSLEDGLKFLSLPGN